MSLPSAILLLFLIGLLHDAISTVSLNVWRDKRIVAASVMSGVVTAYGYLAWAVMARTGLDATTIGVGAYAIGGAVGTFALMLRDARAARAAAPPAPTGTRLRRSKCRASPRSPTACARGRRRHRRRWRGARPKRRAVA